MQAQNSRWLAYVLFVLRQNMNTESDKWKYSGFYIVGRHLNIFRIVGHGCAERLCDIYKWGCEIKKVGNHFATWYFELGLIFLLM